jgi:hypothetical protein
MRPLSISVSRDTDRTPRDAPEQSRWNLAKTKANLVSSISPRSIYQAVRTGPSELQCRIGRLSPHADAGSDGSEGSALARLSEQNARNQK